jgi:peptidoglycan/LPS O-acetylase OafA/YrhL
LRAKKEILMAATENSDREHGLIRSIGSGSASPSSVFSVVIGLCVGVGAAFIIHTVLGIFLSWMFVKSGFRMEDLYYAMSHSTLFNLLSHACSFLAAMFAGGFVSKFKHERPYFHAGLIGILMFVFAAVQFLVPYEHAAPFWSKIVALLVPFPAALFGAYLWQKRAGSVVDRGSS